MRSYRYLDIVTAAFVTVLLLSNLLSSAKIIDLNMQIAGIALIFDAGTLIFPISYIFGDILTEIYGYSRARRVIWIGFGATLLMGFFVWLAGVLPGEAAWEGYAGQGAYQAILGGIPSLIVASLAAYAAGAFTNSYILARLKVATAGHWVPVRTIASTLGGQFIDTAIFIGVAAMLGVFTTGQVIPLIVTNYIFKVAIEVLMTPVTLIVIERLKKAEGEDYYDRETRFNPFRMDVSR
jgi:uncharacterized integral membrane protein (TIGR00697 family)